MKPIVNKETCIGCGACEGICPEVFKLDNGTSIVIEMDDYSQYKEKIDQSIRACPVQAITIEE